MVHTAVVLPLDLLEWLRKDGEAARHGLSGEVRIRLLTTYLLGGPKQDRMTWALLSAIRHLAEKIERDVRKKWHEHPYAHAAFKAGVMELLSRQMLTGDPNKRPDGTGGADDPPEVVGRTLSRLFAMSDQELDAEELYRNLVENSSSGL